jgi:hypothetical protein
MQKKKKNVLFNNFVRALKTNVDCIKRILHSFDDNQLDLVEIDKKNQQNQQITKIRTK